jgi:tryptophan synthase alpha chain
MNGTTPETCMQGVRDARAAGVTTPVIFMGYYNPIFAMGEAEFCRRSAEAGADGLIVPDLPTFEAGSLNDECDKNGMALVPLLALTSTEENIAAACERAAGFIYCVSVLGVTGARDQVGGRVEQLVKLVRTKTDLPVAVGFGISTPDHVARVAAFADGAVIGSALINAVANGPAETAPGRAAKYVRSLVPGTKRVRVAK